jgi:8-oxo-dGTP pyrophosphatase MutT (NUDIX family)
MAADAPMPFKPEGPPRIAGKAAVRPRNAATLILVRRTGRAPEILMGRRARGHDFMPNKWVFPGGRVDRGDFSAPAAAELEPEVEAKLRLTAPGRPTLPRALAMAAVRETWEEVGLMLARPAPARPAAGPWRGFIEAGALPNLSPLRFIARAITPPMIGKRFDARFFMAEADALLSQERAKGSGELDEIAWIPIPEVESFDLPNVTKFVVKELEARLEDPTRPVLSLTARGGARHLARL